MAKRGLSAMLIVMGGRIVHMEGLNQPTSCRQERSAVAQLCEAGDLPVSSAVS